MRRIGKAAISMVILVAAMLQACIHEYPHGTGTNPSKVDVNLHITFSLHWETMLHTTPFATRGRLEKPHRFVIEARKDGEPVYRGEQWLSPEEFLLGTLDYPFPVLMGPYEYEVAVWYEECDDSAESVFDATELTDIRVLDSALAASAPRNCGYASELLDLTPYYSSVNTGVEIDLTLQHAGARFQIVATDVQEFIALQKEALLQGDTFSLQMRVASNSPLSFNAYNGIAGRTAGSLQHEDAMFFPFAEYDELKIGEGFLFSGAGDDVAMTLTVYNSARQIVSQTEEFHIPLRRGYITIVRGDFLTFPINGNLSINHIWDGEIEMEI